LKCARPNSEKRLSEIALAESSPYSRGRAAQSTFHPLADSRGHYPARPTAQGGWEDCSERGHPRRL